VSKPLAGVTDPETGLHFPDLNNPPTELTQTNKILPEPCHFISETGLPLCSVIRPSLLRNAGAISAVHALTGSRLFAGQSKEFFQLLSELSVQADGAHREL
jgi:hypothetical protein